MARASSVTMAKEEIPKAAAVDIKKRLDRVLADREFLLLKCDELRAGNQTAIIGCMNASRDLSAAKLTLYASLQKAWSRLSTNCRRDPKIVSLFSTIQLAAQPGF